MRSAIDLYFDDAVGLPTPGTSAGIDNRISTTLRGSDECWHGFVIKAFELSNRSLSFNVKSQ